MLLRRRVYPVMAPYLLSFQTQGRAVPNPVVLHLPSHSWCAASLRSDMLLRRGFRRTGIQDGPPLLRPNVYINNRNHQLRDDLQEGHVRCPMATSKPFVVCSVATKRYAPSTKGVSRDDSLPAVVPNAGPRRPQPSRFAPSKPFLVCSLSTKRYAPSKRASTNTPITYHDAMSPSSSPDLSSFLSQSCRVVPSLNRCSYRRSNVPSRHPHPIDFPSATFSPSTFAIVNAFTPSRARFATTSDISPKKPRNTSIVTLLRQPCPPLQSLHYHSDLVEQPAPRTSATPSLLPPIFMTITITSPDSLHMPSLQHAHLGRGDRLRAVVATRCSLCGLL
ncbi:hypothetical protein L210DRAFT_2493932 [Boletus edulis BED1]|uniref:Uncharacterized protein n=1 Tax=Boletus edulis BED1 TaxID=1328754 RepID=A0AAD4BP71_BOLED|nr:hypothetical protein L210DRAFT_2493932 [Boletus edulis BED1]